MIFETKDSYKKLFIVGSPRSGTTLMNSIMFASDAFAEYHAEAKLLSICMPKYGDLKNPANRKRFAKDWLASRQFQQTHLSKEEFHNILTSSADYFQVQEKIFSQICQSQNKYAWVDSTPANVFFIADILESIPGSKIIHMVRDGRDVALSLCRLNWVSIPFFIKSEQNRLWWAAHQWKQSVNAGKRASELLGGDHILEVRYEDLISEPEQTLNRVSEFLGEDITAVYRDEFRNLKKGNSAYGNSHPGLSSGSIGRWKGLDEQSLNILNQACGDVLKHYRYPVTDANKGDSINKLDCLVTNFLASKNYFLKRTVLGRFMRDTLNFKLDKIVSN